MTKTVLAIDPGSVSGAYAVVRLVDHGFPHGQSYEVLAVDDLPVLEKNVNASAFSSIIEDTCSRHVQVVVERVSAFPRQGVSSAFNFGRGFGIIEGVVSAHLLPVEFVSPAKWKGALGLNREGEASRALATRLFPGSADKFKRKKDHNRAEAVLLGYYFLGGRKP